MLKAKEREVDEENISVCLSREDALRRHIGLLPLSHSDKAEKNPTTVCLGLHYQHKIPNFLRH